MNKPVYLAVGFIVRGKRRGEKIPVVSSSLSHSFSSWCHSLTILGEAVLLENNFLWNTTNTRTLIYRSRKAFWDCFKFENIGELVSTDQSLISSVIACSLWMNSALVFIPTRFKMRGGKDDTTIIRAQMRYSSVRVIKDWRKWINFSLQACLGALARRLVINVRAS